MVSDPRVSQEPKPGQWPLVILAWTLVGVPLAWGVYVTLTKAALLFR
jgi:hypothetical protein